MEDSADNVATEKEVEFVEVDDVEEETDAAGCDSAEDALASDRGDVVVEAADSAGEGERKGRRSTGMWDAR